MAKQPESVFWERIKPKLKRIGWFYKVQAGSVWGIPDVLGVVNGRFVALELKKKKGGHGGKGERLQKHNLRLIKQYGGYAKLVHPGNWEEVYAELQSL